MACQHLLSPVDVDHLGRTVYECLACERHLTPQAADPAQAEADRHALEAEDEATKAEADL